MAEEQTTPLPKIVLPHGGYEKLIAYRKSDMISQGTVVFCKRFLPAYGDRTVDQMKQAARSCKQNIVEGSSSSGTSKETEILLTNVARSSLDELTEDYRDYLNNHQLAIWPLDDAKAQAAREFAKAHADWADWQHIFETRPSETLANLMLTLCHQERYLLDRMIARQEEDFKQVGDIRERMRVVGAAIRGENLERSIYSHLAESKSFEELQSKASNLTESIARAAQSIKSKRSWK